MVSRTPARCSFHSRRCCTNRGCGFVEEQLLWPQARNRAGFGVPQSPLPILTVQMVSRLAAMVSSQVVPQVCEPLVSSACVASVMLTKCGCSQRHAGGRNFLRRFGRDTVSPAQAEAFRCADCSQIYSVLTMLLCSLTLLSAQKLRWAKSSAEVRHKKMPPPQVGERPSRRTEQEATSNI